MTYTEKSFKNWQRLRLESWEKWRKDGFWAFVLFWGVCVCGFGGAFIFTPLFLYFASERILDSVYFFSFVAFPIVGFLLAAVIWLECESAYHVLKERFQTEDRLKALEAELTELREDARCKSITPTIEQDRSSEAIQE